MKLASQFVVPAAPDKVFPLFFDTGTMRECIPGCEDLHQVDENTYEGNLVNEIAHVKFRADFKAQIKSVTQPELPEAPAVVMALLQGEDRRLGTTIKVDATMKVMPRGDDSLVDYQLELAMWGKLGRLGESVIRRRSMEVERQFATALAAVCGGQAVPRVDRRKSARPQQAAPTPPLQPIAAPTSTSSHAAPASVVASIGSAQPDHTRDLPFVLGVGAAAFCFGVLIGGRRRRS